MPPSERIATFDNDGTLWCRAADLFPVRLRARSRQGAGAASIPNGRRSSRSRRFWRATCRPLAAHRREGDRSRSWRRPTRGMTTRGVHQDRRATGSRSAQHPRFQPPVHRARLPADARAARLSARQRLQDLHRLRRRHRVHAAWTEKVYGIPPEQVVGSSGVVKVRDGRGRQAGADEGAQGRVRRRRARQAGRHQPLHRPPPIFAFGNSDGDQQMLQWTAAGDGARFMGIVHHTDAEREWAYDRQSHIGKLDKALDEAPPKAGPSST